MDAVAVGFEEALVCVGKPLRPEISVQRAVLNRLADMRRSDVGGAFQVGDRAGDFQDTVVRAGTEVEFVHRHFQKSGSSGVERACAFDLL